MRVHVVYALQAGNTPESTFVCLISAVHIPFYVHNESALNTIVAQRAAGGGRWCIRPTAEERVFSFRQKIILWMLAAQRQLDGQFFANDTLFQERLKPQQVVTGTPVATAVGAPVLVDAVPVLEAQTAVIPPVQVAEAQANYVVLFPAVQNQVTATPLTNHRFAMESSLVSAEAVEHSTTTAAAIRRGASPAPAKRPRSTDSSISADRAPSAMATVVDQQPLVQPKQQPRAQSPQKQRSHQQQLLSKEDAKPPPSNATIDPAALVIAKQHFSITTAILRLERFLNNPWIHTIAFNCYFSKTSDRVVWESLIDTLAQEGLIRIVHRRLLGKWKAHRSNAQKRTSSFAPQNVIVLQLVVTRSRLATNSSILMNSSCRLYDQTTRATHRVTISFGLDVQEQLALYFSWITFAVSGFSIVYMGARCIDSWSPVLPSLLPLMRNLTQPTTEARQRAYTLYDEVLKQH